jgi:hypothetical protein
MIFKLNSGNETVTHLAINKKENILISGSKSGEITIYIKKINNMLYQNEFYSWK